MKQEIHPAYQVVKVQCVCGAEYTMRSAAPIRKLEICSSCHPFFTGKQKLIDTAGRVEKFRQRYANFAPAEKK